MFEISLFLKDYIGLNVTNLIDLTQENTLHKKYESISLKCTLIALCIYELHSRKVFVSKICLLLRLIKMPHPLTSNVIATSLKELQQI